MPEATPSVGQPTIAEAVAFIVRHHRDPVFASYRRACLADWRDRYGDAFADKVKAGVEAAWRSR